MDLQLKGKKALVTGSTAGIGFAIAKQLAFEGATVVINGRTVERVNTAIADIKTATNNDAVTGYAADFADIVQIDKLISQVTDVDILVNNVGIFEPKTFEAITDADWFKFFEVNVLSGIRLSRVCFDKCCKRIMGELSLHQANQHCRFHRK